MRKFIPLVALATSFLIVALSNTNISADYPTSSYQYNNNNTQLMPNSQQYNSNNTQMMPTATPDYNSTQNMQTPSVVTPQAPQPTMMTEKISVVEVVTQDPALSTFVSALESTDLASLLERPGPYTLFVPNNEAFKKLSPETLDNLLLPEHKEKLKAILKYHVIPGAISSTDVKSGKLFTLNGTPITITVDGKEIKIDEAKVIKSDLKGTNGVVHVIDTVLMPKS